MSILQIVLGVAAFAVVTAVLYVWGMRKSDTQTQDLTRMLTSKCANKVLRLFKKSEVITQSDAANAVRDVKASQFWSKKAATVQQPQAFAKTLLSWMESQQLIEKCSGGYRKK